MLAYKHNYSRPRNIRIRTTMTGQMRIVPAYPIRVQCISKKEWKGIIKMIPITQRRGWFKRQLKHVVSVYSRILDPKGHKYPAV